MNLRNGVIVFVDSDDALPADALELLTAPLVDLSVGFTSGRYISMDESGQVSNEASSKISGGFAWGHAFRREVWRRVEFPEGYWFEDTVLKYCVFGLWHESTLDDVVYHYRVNRNGISHTSKTSKKSLDTVWVVQQMLAWRRSLGGAFDQWLFDQTLRQFGSLAYDRLEALDEEEKRPAFALMCDVLSSEPEFEDMETNMRGLWVDVLLALRTRNYRLWCLSCYFL